MKCFWNSLFCEYLLPNTWQCVGQELQQPVQDLGVSPGLFPFPASLHPLFLPFPTHTISNINWITPVSLKMWDSIWKMGVRGVGLGEGSGDRGCLQCSVPAPPCRAKLSCPLERDSGAPASPRIIPGSCEQPEKQLQLLWWCKILLSFKRTKCESQWRFLCAHPRVSSSPLKQDESVCVCGAAIFTAIPWEQQWQNMTCVITLPFPHHPPLPSSLSSSPFSSLVAAALTSAQQT